MVFVCLRRRFERSVTQHRFKGRNAALWRCNIPSNRKPTLSRQSGVPATAAFRKPSLTLERQKWGRLRNVSFSQFLPRNRPVRRRLRMRRKLISADEWRATLAKWAAGPLAGNIKCMGRDADLRLDHLLLSPNLKDRLVDVGVDREFRGGEAASGHAPVWLDKLGGWATALPQMPRGRPQCPLDRHPITRHKRPKRIVVDRD